MVTDAKQPSPATSAKPASKSAASTDSARPKNKKKMSKGGVNLIILGVAAITVAIVTTSVSLMLYHNSGDIYLDRSRPGYLPDEEEIEDDDTEPDYNFGKTGKIDPTTIDEYLDNLNTEVQAIDAYDKPFGADALSDERLGIPAE